MHFDGYHPVVARGQLGGSSRSDTRWTCEALSRDRKETRRIIRAESLLECDLTQTFVPRSTVGRFERDQDLDQHNRSF